MIVYSITQITSEGRRLFKAFSHQGPQEILPQLKQSQQVHEINIWTAFMENA